MPQSQVPISSETTYYNAQKGTAITKEGRPALVFVDLTGEAHLFPFEEDDAHVELIKLLLQLGVTDDQKKELLELLTGGLVTATSLDLPPGVKV